METVIKRAMFKDLSVENFNFEESDLSAVGVDGLESVGSYIAKRLKNECPEPGIFTPGNKEAWDQIH